ncbi:dipeptidyl-peptidase-like protein V precursor [Microthyrium microscopicum]|uniref:Dipeptidyl-peptidase V n=1 Tax=Microthyrium microscopicum TaxID=703497 RepID=A0A6A6UMJ2_9PEZI|nr:dipeptidyl-peptidase-like protein V precursor [Microthyrium microscopicum]
MTIRAAHFTPEVLLEAPRRSEATPNSKGSLALFSVSTYSFSEHKRQSELRVLDISRNESKLVTDSEDASNPKFLDDNLITVLESKDGATNVLIGDVNDFKKTNYTAGTIDGSVDDWKIKDVGKGKYLIAIAASTQPDGTLYNSEKAKKPVTTGRIYNSTFVRHWDTWVTANKNSIWVGTLSKDSKTSKFALGHFENKLKDSGLESPIPPFGGAGDFDITDTNLAFVAKDPKLNPAFNTKQNLYVIKLDNGSSPKKIDIPGFEGATSNPNFSPDGKKLAFLSMVQNGYEADKNQIFLLDVEQSDPPKGLFTTPDNKGTWDRSPSSITWSNDQKNLYVTAEENARVKLFSIPLAANSTNSSFPKAVFDEGSVASTTFLDSGLFISSSSLIDNSAYHLVPSSGAPKLLSSSSRSGSSFGLSRSQVSEIHFPGAKPGTTIQAWLIKPSFFDDSKKYPLAYLVHGGPQGAWEDSWSTRWNPAVFAEQGYVVVTPNPTGSTGFGQELTDAIGGEWGGLPYQDLVNGFDYVEKNLSYVDTDRAVALGASYGGYMMNWIQGNDLGRKFKALVTHDGVFSIPGQLGTEEIYFPNREFGGPFWENKDAWNKWDPAQKTENWATPHLIIHSEKDFRLTIAEGLAAFNVLQEKGVESQFLTFPDENHWVLKPENSLLWHTVVLDFINRKVGLKAYSEQSETAKALKESALSG